MDRYVPPQIITIQQVENFEASPNTAEKLQSLEKARAQHSECSHTVPYGDFFRMLRLFMRLFVSPVPKYSYSYLQVPICGNAPRYTLLSNVKAALIRPPHFVGY
ncbi:hypothetical protein Trydic_g3932 [Trypoxylus dichotomus]